MAQDLKYYGLPVNRNTVRLHHTFSPTECPKRSLIEHCGYDSTLAVPTAISLKLQDYFISQVAKYYNNPSMKPGDIIGDKPEPEKPSKPQSHDEAVLASSAKHQGNAYGKLEFFNGVKQDTAEVRGWLVPDKPQGAIGKYAFVLFMEHGTGKELTRVQSPGVARPDVKKAYGYQGGDALGFKVQVNTKQFKGKKVDVIFRRANKTNGEGAVNDVRIDSIYLTF